MSPLFSYLLISAVGIAVAVGIIGRYIPSVRSLSRDDQRKWLYRLPPFFAFLGEWWGARVHPHAVRAWNTHAHPVVFGAGERWSRRFHIFALRFERLFHRLSDYFRSKRMAMQNGDTSGAQGKNSQFWNEIQRIKSAVSGKKDPPSRIAPR